MLQIANWLLSVSFLLVPMQNAWGQNCNHAIKGLVEDVEGEVLIGATVVIGSLQKGVTTDTNGNFLLGDLCAGSYDLTIRYVGYEDQQIAVRVPAPRGLVVKMKHSVKILHDVVVEGQHSQKHAVSQSLGILSEDQIAAAKGKPLGEMIRQLAGVQSITTGGAIFKPVIHGLYGQRLLVLNNGLRQEGQQWGLEHAPEIDSYVASEIEVVKGSEAVRYGAEALGGVIIINAQPLHYLSSVGGEFNAGLNSNARSAAFSAMLEGGITRHAGWRVQGTIKKGGDFHAPDYNLSNTAMEEADLSATLGFEKDGRSLEFYASTYNTEIGILRSAHVGNLTDLQQSIVARQPRYISEFTYRIGDPRQKVSHHLARLTGSAEVGEHLKLRGVYGFQLDQRREYDVTRTMNSIPLFAVDLFAQSVDISVDHNFSKWSGSAGVTGIWRDNYNEKGTTLLPDYQQVNGGVFVTEKFRNNKWVLEAGARYDLQKSKAWVYDGEFLLVPSFNLNYYALSAGASYHINSNTRLASHASVANRPPHISELFSRGLHHSAASIENGLMVRDGVVSTNEDNIKSERSHQWVNSLQYTRKGISAELSVYANYFDDYIYLTPAGTQLTIRGFFPVFEYRQTNALLVGGDAFASIDVHPNVTMSTKFSWVRAEDRRKNNMLPFIPPADWDNSVTYHRSNVGPWRNIYATVAAEIVFAQSRAPRTVYPAEITTADLTSTFDFMPAPGTYVICKAETGAKLALNNREMTISFTVENLLDASYRNYMSRLRYYADEPGRNFSVRISYNFHTH
jgi:iron complex outermembrane recepter protein